MKPDWPRLKELFDLAAMLDADERTRLLDRECASEPEVRRQVEELLLAHDAAGEFLAAPTEPRLGNLAATGDATDPAEAATIGPYKLLHRIGEGGFGVVYMAEQQAPIVRRVALKVIKPGLDTEQVIARFEQERQALALMDHTNIARILDAGATDSGRPYFVMELVRGIPITEYCDHQRMIIRQRFELFLPICHAVAHAHQKGVIHRDLKPSNVLVTLHDGAPVPKVIDFGIARAIHQRLTDRTFFTEYGQLIGTPEYMSPEQGEMSGLDIDTRTDIYSLGALLYELLTGQQLFDPKRLRSLPLGKIQQVLREEEPPRPSARVSSLGATANEVAKRRGVHAAQLNRILRGDPDWIVVKAIAKCRTRRYDSVGALGTDIERYLRSEPVSAGPPGPVYRASSYVRRHRVGVRVAFAVVASLLLGIILAMLGLVRPRAIPTSGERADHPTELVDPVVHEAYVRGLYHLNRRTPEDLRLALRYFQRAIDRDSTYAKAWVGLSDTYGLMPQYGSANEAEVMPKARAAAQKALALDSTLAEAYASLGNIEKSSTFDWKAAEYYYRKAIALNPDYATAHHWYAVLLVWTGRVQDGLAEIERAHDLDPLSPMIQLTRARIWYLARDYPRAAQEYQQAIELDPRRSSAWRGLSGVYFQQNRFREASATWERSIALLPDSIGLMPARTLDGTASGYLRRRLTTTLILAHHHLASPAELAAVYAHLGARDEAFQLLESARSDELVLGDLRTLPDYDSLRGDLRYEVLENRLARRQSED